MYTRPSVIKIIIVILLIFILISIIMLYNEYTSAKAQSHYNTIIVGVGGLEVTRQLQHKNKMSPHDILLLEGANEIGGIMKSTQIDNETMHHSYIGVDTKSNAKDIFDDLNVKTITATITDKRPYVIGETEETVEYIIPQYTDLPNAIYRALPSPQVLKTNKFVKYVERSSNQWNVYIDDVNQPLPYTCNNLIICTQAEPAQHILKRVIRYDWTKFLFNFYDTTRHYSIEPSNGNITDNLLLTDSDNAMFSFTERIGIKGKQKLPHAKNLYYCSTDLSGGLEQTLLYAREISYKL